MDLNILSSTNFLILNSRALSLFSLTEKSFIWCGQVTYWSFFTPSIWHLQLDKYFWQLTFIIKLFSSRLKNDHFSFLKFSEILFALIQFSRLFRSIVTNLLRFLIDLRKYNKLVSSGKWWTLQDFVAWLRSLIYSKNNRGPRTDPWGIPQFF